MKVTPVIFIALVASMAIASAVAQAHDVPLNEQGNSDGIDSAQVNKLLHDLLELEDEFLELNVIAAELRTHIFNQNNFISSLYDLNVMCEKSARECEDRETARNAKTQAEKDEIQAEKDALYDEWLNQAYYNEMQDTRKVRIWGRKPVREIIRDNRPFYKKWF
jgi:hypothetical protein